MLHHKSTRTSSGLAFCKTKKAVSSLALAFVLSAVFTSAVTAKESKQAQLEAENQRDIAVNAKKNIEKSTDYIEVIWKYVYSLKLKEHFSAFQ